jgi:hypothetical protein
MLKEAACIAGAAFMFSPIGMPFTAHGIAGLIVGTAGLHLANTIVEDIKDAMENSKNENRQDGKKAEEQTD